MIDRPAKQLIFGTATVWYCKTKLHSNDPGWGKGQKGKGAGAAMIITKGQELGSQALTSKHPAFKWKISEVFLDQVECRSLNNT